MQVSVFCRSLWLEPRAEVYAKRRTFNDGLFLLQFAVQSSDLSVFQRDLERREFRENTGQHAIGQIRFQEGPMGEERRAGDRKEARAFLISLFIFSLNFYFSFLF